MKCKKQNTEEQQKDNDELLKWFEKTWIDEDITETKLNFYSWFENNYNEHLVKHEKNKKDYWKNQKILSRCKAIIEEKKNHKIIFSVKTGCFSGASSMVANFFGSKVLKGWAKSLDIENIIIFGICWIVVTILIYVIITAILGWIQRYYENTNMREQPKETWIRHTKALGDYQKILLEYLCDIEPFGHLYSEEDKEKLLERRIIKAWEENLQLFQRNMNKER